MCLHVFLIVFFTNKIIYVLLEIVLWIFHQFLPSFLKNDKNSFLFSSQFRHAGCRGSRLGFSLFNRLGLRGVPHKAGESTVGVGVSGVSAKFSKSSQCVSQWQHVLGSLQGNHECTSSHATGHTDISCTSWNTWQCSEHAEISAFEMHVNKRHQVASQFSP